MPGKNKTVAKTGDKLVKDASYNSNAPAQTQNPGPAGDDTYKQIAIIGDEDTVIGFGLTGVKYLSPISDSDSDDELIMVIKEYIQNNKIGFVLITQNVAERVRQVFEIIKQTKPLYPIFIELL